MVVISAIRNAGAAQHLDYCAEQSVGRGAAGRVGPEVNVDWRRPGQRKTLGGATRISKSSTTKQQKDQT